jgi:hypothetical protein
MPITAGTPTMPASPGEDAASERAVPDCRACPLRAFCAGRYPLLAALCDAATTTPAAASPST